MPRRSLPRRIAGRVKRAFRPAAPTPQPTRPAADQERAPVEPSVEEPPTVEPSVEEPGAAEAPRERPTLRTIAAPPTLVDDRAQAEFEDLGFTVIDLLSPEQAEALLGEWRGLHPEPGNTGAWECDFYSDDSEVKARAYDAIQDALRASIEAHFVDHETFLHNFVMNWPGTEGGLELHQHSSVVDEDRFRSAVIWCALTDSTEANGTLNVVPKSHRVLHHHKPERSPEWFDGLHSYLVENHLTAVSLRPGQALVFDNGVLHCSFANTTDSPRVTAVATLARRDSALRYYDWVGDGSVNIYELEPSFFIEQVAGQFEWAKPEGLDVVGVEEIDFRVLTEDEVAALLPEGSAGRGDKVAGWL